MTSIKKYDIFEASFSAACEGNPFKDVTLTATFSHGGQNVGVHGFYDGDGTWRVRFMPQEEGEWTYATSSNLAALDKREGSFTCIAADESNHGPVRVNHTYHFAHADGTRHISVGTTCYAWVYQPLARQEQTVETLKNSPFNKIRMCVFPKWYEHNYDKTPILFPYESSVEEGFDYERPNPEFFRLLEKRVGQLAENQIQADIIIFHPYENDKWAFNYMDEEQDKLYMRYLVARLGAYHNVWWSMANEWDIFVLTRRNCPKSDIAYWDTLGRFIHDEDPYGHLIGIHNCMQIYDHGADWITHSSMQRVDYYKTAEMTDTWRKNWNKPVVVDECAYEGNNDHAWGNITGEEMTRRFWEGTVRGGYMGHGETYVCPEDILWWSHGGVLKGTSPKRIAFMKELLEEYPQYEIEPISEFGDVLCGGCPKDYYLYYYSLFQPCKGHYNLPISRMYKAEVIDTWNMTREELPGTYTGAVTIDLPSRPYMLVRFVAVEEVDLSTVTITADSTFADAADMPNGYKLLDMLKAQMGEQFEQAKGFIWNQPIKSLQQFGGLGDEQLAGMLAMVNEKA